MENFGGARFRERSCRYLPPLNLATSNIYAVVCFVGKRFDKVSLLLSLSLSPTRRYLYIEFQSKLDYVIRYLPYIRVVVDEHFRLSYTSISFYKYFFHITTVNSESRYYTYNSYFI